METRSPVTFRDGLESGSFSKWSGTSLSSGETAYVAGTDNHHGAKSGKFTTNGGGGYEGSCSYKTIEPSSDLYARRYFYVSQSGISAGDDRSYFIVFRSGSNSLAYAGWRMTGGVVKWCLTLREGTGYVDVYASSSSPSAGRWYCVELHWTEHPSTGYAEMWVDGSLMCSSQGGDMLGFGGASQVRFGLPEVKAGSTTVYCDCVIVADTYVGPESDVIPEYPHPMFLVLPLLAVTILAAFLTTRGKFRRLGT